MYRILPTVGQTIIDKKRKDKYVSYSKQKLKPKKKKKCESLQLLKTYLAPWLIREGSRPYLIG